MKTRAVGTTATPSKESCGSNRSTPSASRRSVTRTLPRGILSRSVKFSFRSIAVVDHAHHEIAPRIEPFHRQLKLRFRGDQLERVRRGDPETNARGVNADGIAGEQVEIERAVLPERVAGPETIGNLAVQRPSDRRAGASYGEPVRDPPDRYAAAATPARLIAMTFTARSAGGVDRNARCHAAFVQRFVAGVDGEEIG